jgi:phosphoribosylformylglycinamidine cyclo-ligase
VSDAYARAGVDQSAAESAVAAIVAELERIDLGRPSRQVLRSGHYANVIRIDERRGIALATDGVGTKLALAEELGRWEGVGIDCIGMNVNDVICVGAEPVAMLDYIAVPSADPRVLGTVASGLRRGAELAGIEIPGGELAQMGDLVRGLDLVGACFGLVELDSIVTGAEIVPGDAVIGLPSSGLHSNGYTLARKALRSIPLDDARLGRPLGEVLLEPTTIYVRAVLDLLASAVRVRGLAHITSGGLSNLERLEADVGYEIDAPLPAPRVFALIAELGEVDEAEMREVFNMGCGFCCVVPAEQADAAIEILGSRHPGAAVIGRATDREGVVELPGQGLTGRRDAGFAPAS